MRIGDIKKGRWYETVQGSGPCITSGGTRPPSVMIEIRSPFPRGRVNLTPRQVLKEISPPTPTQPEETDRV